MIHFIEQQRFPFRWFWTLVSITSMLLITDFYVTHQIQTSIPRSTYLIVLVALLGCSLTFSLIHMNTYIDGYGIKLKLTRFNVKGWEWTWGEIKDAYIRECNPIKEFRGWGIKKTHKNNRAFNVKGKMGIQLELTNGQLIFIGTQKSDELARILMALKEQQRIHSIR